MSISRQIDCGAFNAAQSKKWGGFIGLEGNNDAVWLGISDLDRPGTRDQRPLPLWRFRAGVLPVKLNSSTAPVSFSHSPNARQF